MYVVKRMNYEKWKQGDTHWKTPTDVFRNDLPAKAWHWAERRSLEYRSVVYQVFNEETGQKHGNPYYRGKVLSAAPDSTVKYEVFFKYSEGSEKWSPWDSSPKPGKLYSTLDDVIARTRGTQFTGKCPVRIWRDGTIIYEGLPTTKELIIWLEIYQRGNETNPPTTQGQESDMHLSKPLNIPVKTMADKVSAYLAERQKEHDEKVDLAAVKNDRRLEVFHALIAAEPTRIFTYLAEGNGTGFATLVSQIVDGDRTQEDVLENTIGKMKEFAEVGEYQADTEAEKLLSVLNATSDETIEVSSESSLYRYL